MGCCLILIRVVNLSYFVCESIKLLIFMRKANNASLIKRLLGYGSIMIFLLTPFLLTGQAIPKTLYFSKLEQNLPRSFQSLMEDRSGYLWFCTGGGLARYDGASLKLYKADINDFNSLSSSYTLWMTEGKDGKLWISTKRGLNVFDPIVREFHSFFNDESNLTTITNNRPLQLTTDDDGFIWIGFDDAAGLNRLDPTSGKSKRFYVRRGRSGSLQGRVLGEILADRDRIYLGTTAGLEYYDKKNGKFHFLPLLNKAKDTIYYTVRTICKTRDGKIWMNMPGDGLRVYDPATQSVTAYQLPAGGLQVPSITDIAEGKDGRLWLSNANSLWSLTPNRGALQRHQTKMIGREDREAGYGKLYVDRYGMLWMNGQYFDPRRNLFQHHQMLSGKDQKPYFVEGAGKINDSTLIVIIKDENNQFVFYEYSLKTRVASKIVFPPASSLAESGFSPSDLNWRRIRLNQEVYFYNLVTRKLCPFIIKKKGRPPPYTMGTAFDRQGNFWMSTWGDGLIRVRKDVWQQGHDTITTFDHWLPGGPRPTIPTDQLLDLTVDSRNQVWFGCSTGGLVRIDANTDEFYYYDFEKGANTVSDTYIFDIIEGNDGNIWISTNSGGLNKYNVETQQFTIYNEQRGMLDEDLYFLATDRDGHLWMNTTSGITHFNPKTEQFTHYNQLDGVLAWQTTGGVSHPANWLIWSGNEGFILAQLDSLKNRPTYTSDLRIGDIRVFDQGTKNLQSLAPKQWQENTLSLSYRENALEIRFAVLDFRNTIKHRYQYALTQGGEPNWIDLGRENQVSLNQLSPGTYHLHLKGRNSDYIWTELPEPLTIIIHPPFWQTTWAYLFYALLLGTVIYYFYSITLKRQLAQQEANQVKEMDGLKSRFYTNITHEFRTPLTVILGANEQEDNPKARDLIRRNGQKLLQLINQLLDLSRLDTGLLQPNYQEIEIVAFTRYIGESFQSLADRKYIQLTIYSEIDELWMGMDEEKFRQIISNLLSNAVKFSPENGKIILHLALADQQLVIKIKDNGPGISKTELPHIFDRFYQADHPANQQGKGTGIGLALVNELVELLEGEITVNSVLGIGTTFEVRIPTCHTAAQPLENFEPIIADGSILEPADVPEVMQSKELPQLLIIEDNPDVLHYIQSLLEQQYALHFAKDGAEGVQKALDQIPDIIISDVMMPGKTGFEVVEILKEDERTSHIPIILLTAKATQRDRIQGLRHGADAYLLKPFDQEELFVRLNKLIELRRRLQEKYKGFQPKDRETTNPDERFLQKLHQIVQQYLGDAEFNVERLSQAAGMSHTQLYRKLKALTDKTPTQFMTSIRLEAAKNLLRNSDLNISEIAYEVGFSSPNYFTRVFSNEFGKSPNKFRR